MTVAELIAELQKYPPAYKVLLDDWNERWAGTTDVRLDEILVDDEEQEVVFGVPRL